MKTTDMDILIKNRNKPNYKIDIISAFKERNFDCEISYNGITKLFKENLEIEFLTRELGPGQTEPYKIESFGIKAEGLRFIEYIIDYAIPIVVHNFFIWVPSPAAYTIHKIIINYKRVDFKKKKDMIAV